jgi:CRISPR-associated protein Csd2
LFDVVNGNPNGDPDAGNMPRIDPETNYGFVTDVAIKRKIRNYVSLVYNKEIYIQSKSALNTLYYKVADDAGLKFPETEVTDDGLLEWLDQYASDLIEVDTENKRVKYMHELSKDIGIIEKLQEEGIDIPANLEKKLKDLTKKLLKVKEEIDKKVTQKKRDEVNDQMAKKYYDIRMFGAVLTAGTNAGQIRGPVQLTFARSISPIQPIDVSITRVAITKESDKKNKQTEMGRKPVIPYGLYRAHGFYNPKLAERLTQDGNPVSTDDLKILWEAMLNMFDYDRSASRGEMTCRGLYVFTHKDEKGLGNMPAHKLFERIKIVQKDITKVPRSFDDYKVELSIENLPESIAFKNLCEDSYV